MSEVYFRHLAAGVAVWAAIMIVLGLAIVIVDLFTDWED